MVSIYIAATVLEWGVRCSCFVLLCCTCCLKSDCHFRSCCIPLLLHCNCSSDPSGDNIRLMKAMHHRQASGDGRLLNPVALVENHPACRKNDQGWGILPNQQVWKPHLILLLLSSKLLSETDSLLKIQQNTGAANNQQANALRMLLGGAGRKMPPIPYLIASFIQKKSVSAGLLTHASMPRIQ